jgi:hypothetical protein
MLSEFDDVRTNFQSSGWKHDNQTSHAGSAWVYTHWQEKLSRHTLLRHIELNLTFQAWNLVHIHLADAGRLTIKQIRAQISRLKFQQK